MGTNAGEGKKQENKKEEILKVSREFFIEQGYEKTSMRQIAAAADVSLGLVAYHFKTKRDIAQYVPVECLIFLRGKDHVIQIDKKS